MHAASNQKRDLPSNPIHVCQEPHLDMHAASNQKRDLPSNPFHVCQEPHLDMHAASVQKRELLRTLFVNVRSLTLTCTLPLSRSASFHAVHCALCTCTRSHCASQDNFCEPGVALYP